MSPPVRVVEFACQSSASKPRRPTCLYFNEVDRGGHFAAWQEPALFATEVRAAFRSLR